MTVLMGFRIEFADDSGDLVGSVTIEDAFRVSAVPKPGDYVAIAGLTEDRHAGAWWPGKGPFHQVQHLEHYPVPAGAADLPAVTAVLRVPAPGTYQAAPLVRAFGSAGWTVDSFDNLKQPGPDASLVSPFGQAVDEWRTEQGQ